MVQNVQRIFSNFPIIFQFSLYMQKLTPTWLKISEEYLAIDNNVETGRDLQDTNILDLIRLESATDSQSEVPSDNEAEEPPCPTVSLTELRKVPMIMQGFFEDRNTLEGVQMISSALTLAESISARTTKQTSIVSLFHRA